MSCVINGVEMKIHTTYNTGEDLSHIFARNIAARNGNFASHKESEFAHSIISRGLSLCADCSEEWAIELLKEIEDVTYIEDECGIIPVLIGARFKPINSEDSEVKPVPIAWLFLIDKQGVYRKYRVRFKYTGKTYVRHLMHYIADRLELVWRREEYVETISEQIDMFAQMDSTSC